MQFVLANYSSVWRGLNKTLYEEEQQHKEITYVFP